MIGVDTNISIADEYGDTVSGEYCGARVEGDRTVAFFTDRVSYHTGSLTCLVPHPELLDVCRGRHDLAFHTREFFHLKNILSDRTDLNIRMMHIWLEKGQFIVGLDIDPYSRDLADEIKRIAFPIATVVRPAEHPQCNVATTNRMRGTPGASTSLGTTV
jgi:hypothetical protein